MSLFSIELATLADVAQLCELEQASFHTDLISAAQYRAFIRKTSSAVSIVRCDKDIIACAIVLYRKDAKCARLYSIAVSAHYHGKQVAQSLLTFIEEQARARKCHEMRLEVSVNNARAIRFYERNHYQRFAEIPAFYENGEDALRMKKRLDDVELK